MGNNDKLLVVCKSCCKKLDMLYRPDYIDYSDSYKIQVCSCGSKKDVTNLTYGEVQVINSVSISFKWDFYEKLMYLKVSEPESYEDAYNQLLELRSIKNKDVREFNEKKVALEKTLSNDNEAEDDYQFDPSNDNEVDDNNTLLETVKISKKPTKYCPVCKSSASRFELSKIDDQKYTFKCHNCGHIFPFKKGIEINRKDLNGYIKKCSVKDEESIVKNDIYRGKGSVEGKDNFYGHREETVIKSAGKVCMVIGFILLVCGLYSICTGSVGGGFACLVFSVILFFVGVINPILVSEGEIPDEEQRRENEAKVIEAERQVATNSQKENAPWDQRYYTNPCPYCGHYKVRPAKWDDKRLSVAFWGIASSKIGTQYKCENCNRMWT